jgi:T-complex protein 1 subunit beta
LFLGGEIVSTFDTPDKVKLGKCDLIEEIIIGEDKLIKFSGLLFFFNRTGKNSYYVMEYLGVGQGQACTIVLRGATQQILDEAERSIHDVLCVLSQTVKEPRICYGGGLLKINSR